MCRYAKDGDPEEVIKEKKRILYDGPHKSHRLCEVLWATLDKLDESSLHDLEALDWNLSGKLVCRSFVRLGTGNGGCET